MQGFLNVKKTRSWAKRGGGVKTPTPFPDPHRLCSKINRKSGRIFTFQDNLMREVGPVSLGL